jgi:hypothetical protein
VGSCRVQFYFLTLLSRSIFHRFNYYSPICTIIEIENLIYIKVQENFTSITPELSNNQLDKIKKFDFWAKIQLYKLLNNNEICEKLNDLRGLRNPNSKKHAVNSITL